MTAPNSEVVFLGEDEVEKIVRRQLADQLEGLRRDLRAEIEALRREISALRG
jgi:hypothetical protein